MRIELLRNYSRSNWWSLSSISEQIQSWFYSFLYSQICYRSHSNPEYLGMILWGYQFIGLVRRQWWNCLRHSTILWKYLISNYEQASWNQDYLCGIPANSMNWADTWASQSTYKYLPSWELGEHFDCDLFLLCLKCRDLSTNCDGVALSSIPRMQESLHLPRRDWDGSDLLLHLLEFFFLVSDFAFASYSWGALGEIHLPCSILSILVCCSFHSWSFSRLSASRAEMGDLLELGSWLIFSSLAPVRRQPKASASLSAKIRMR